MRERLVAAFVGLTVLIVAAYGIPRAYFLADLVRDQEQHRVDRTADLVAKNLDQHVAAGGEITPTYLDTLTGSSERIQVTGETTMVSTDGPAWDEDDINATRSIADGKKVTVSRGADSVQNE